MATGDRELCGSTTVSRSSIRVVRLQALVRQQHGVIARGQLESLGYSTSAITRLVRRGVLVRLHAGVYGFGHGPLTIEGRLVAALHRAGPGAALSHTTAAYWWRLIDTPPRVIHVSVSRELGSTATLRVHRRDLVDRVTVRRLAVTSVARTLRDLAAVTDSRTLRGALARADQRHLLRAPALHRQLGRGRRGAAALRRALEAHLPELDAAVNVFETEFLLLVERAGLPLPEVNGWVEGLKVDAVWRDRRHVVELDGHATHANPIANETDRQREMTLRAAGFSVNRYTWRQVHRQADSVVADLRRELGSPA